MVNEFYPYYTCGCGQQFQVLISTGEFNDEGREYFIFDEETTYSQYMGHDCPIA